MQKQTKEVPFMGKREKKNVGRLSELGFEM